MSELMPIKELIEPIENLSSEVSKQQDSSRIRFIGCAIQAAKNAAKIDKPKYEIRKLLETNMDMMKQWLKEWAEEDGL